MKALLAQAAPALTLLTGGGHRAWVVGGAVRDALMGRVLGDVDLATDAPPARVLELAAAAGARALPTGIEHGTVTLLMGRPFEVTTLRRDMSTDGRHAVVAFGTSLEEDAARRDFSFNALYLDPEGTLLDPVGGLPDLHARRVRFVGDARERVREDHLRSLRFFRLHATHGDPAGGIDADALDAVARNLDGLETLSRERVTAEILRLLAAPDPAPALAAMRSAGALHRVLPGAAAEAVAPLVHVEEALGLPPDPIRRLAALSNGEGLRLSARDARRLSALRDLPDLSPAALGYRLKGDADDALALRAAALGQEPDPADLAAARDGAGRAFPLRGGDLPLTGPALGEALRALEARWVASGFTLSRDDLLAP